MRFSLDDKQQLRDLITETLSTLPIANSPNTTTDQSALITEAVNKAVQPLHNEITNLRDLLVDTREQIQSLQDKIIEKNAKIVQLENKVIAATQRNVELHSIIAEKSDEHESYSRKDCLRINGIPAQPYETNETLQRAVIDKLSENGVEIDDADIFRLHRSGKMHPLNKFKDYYFLQ